MHLGRLTLQQNEEAQQFAAAVGDRKIDLADFKPGGVDVDGLSFLFTVKSTDQIERRRRTVAKSDRGALARIEPRPLSRGFLGIGRFSDGQFVIDLLRDFEEPRHIVARDFETLYLSTATSLVKLDRNLNARGEISHPLFGFLHTLDLSKDAQKLLVCSTGFDSVLEVDLSDNRPRLLWNAWESGLNPDQDGNWLTLDPHTHDRRLRENKSSVLVAPENWRALGIAQSYRSAHPNVAVYEDDHSFIVNIAFTGALYRVDIRDGSMEHIATLPPMSHGLRRLKDGWGVVETTIGCWTILDGNCKPRGSVYSRFLPNRHRDAGNLEWLQHVLFPGGTIGVFFDANRGIYAADIKRQRIQYFATPEQYCFQDAILR